MSEWLLVFINAALLAVAVPVVMLFSERGRARLQSGDFRTAGIWETAQGVFWYYLICCFVVVIALGALGVFGPIPIEESYRR